MPHPTHWTCSSCSRTLGLVGRDGALTVEGQRVIVSGVAADAGSIVIVVCPGCDQRRRWEPRPPGFEVKAS